MRTQLHRFDMEHLDTFLSRHEPFDALGADELRELTAGAQERSFETGAG